jgi:diphthamide biosynthesis enzyme Dph1/Dph2-like protein
MVKVFFIDSKYKGNVLLTKQAISKCKEYNSIALYASVQFTGKLNKLIVQLKKQNINVIISKPDRATEKSQILGCDVFYKNLNLSKEPDAFLYVGDGNFHPNALVFAQKDNVSFKPIICFNPINKELKIIDSYDFKMYRGALMKFLTSENIGVFVSTKQGQQQYLQCKQLEKIYSVKTGKNFYYFISDSFNKNELENFCFIDCWVNSACPRISYDDIQSMVSINDALNAKELLSKDSLLTR